MRRKYPCTRTPNVVKNLEYIANRNMKNRGLIEEFFMNILKKNYENRSTLSP